MSLLFADGTNMFRMTWLLSSVTNWQSVGPALMQDVYLDSEKYKWESQHLREFSVALLQEIPQS